MNQIDYLRLLCGAASGIICVHDTNGNITTSPCDVDSIVSAYDRAVAERDEAVSLLTALRAKIRHVDPLLQAQAAFSYIHGQYWPEGDENNWTVELKNIDAFLARLNDQTKTGE